jgi:NAD(P)-dependent dehydrogenase (short-subunit alcohol dehydrogenase family)
LAYDFTGKTAAVTGTSGIGLDAALHLARYGARVFLAGIDADLNEAAEKAAGDLAVSVHQIDVSDDGSVAAWFDAIAAATPTLDILVNAAAIQTYGTIETTTPADWDRSIAVNLRSCYLTAHHGYRLMKAAGSGAIVHVSSVQGHANQDGVLAYATTKGAIHALTRAMAVDCARDGIRVNSISPGSIRTPLLEFSARSLASQGQSEEEMIAAFGRAHPIGRVGKVSETSALIAYLCSDAAGFTTGADFLIDGGLSARIGV